MKMSIEIPSAIKLEDAFFCLSCEVVTNCSDNCPECGHRRLWPLENWLGRVNDPENSEDKKSTLEEVPPENVSGGIMGKRVREGNDHIIRLTYRLYLRCFLFSKWLLPGICRHIPRSPRRGPHQFWLCSSSGPRLIPGI